MSDTANGTKRCDSKKITEIRFGSRHTALVARAGEISTADLFQDVFEEMAASVKVENWRTIANLAEAAIKRTKQKMLDGFYHKDLKKGQSQQFLEDHRGWFLLAYCFNGEPYMFLLDSVGANPIKQTHPFVALGSGASIAGSILEGAVFNGLEEYEAVALAFYTIEMCKRTDLYCSGPVQAARADGKTSQTEICDWTVTDAMDEAIRKTQVVVRDTLAKQIRKNFNRKMMEYVFDLNPTK